MKIKLFTWLCALFLLVVLFSTQSCTKDNSTMSTSTTTTSGGSSSGSGGGSSGGTGGCPTTSSCGCSGLNKTPCESNYCCKWTVGSGCGCK